MSATKSRPYALYINENFPQRAVHALRILGYDVLTLKEDGKAEKRYPDEAVLREVGQGACNLRRFVDLKARCEGLPETLQPRLEVPLAVAGHGGVQQSTAGRSAKLATSVANIGDGTMPRRCRTWRTISA